MRWLCRCECKEEIIIHAYNLTSGHTKSCGCLQREQAHNHNNSIRVWKYSIGDSIVDNKRNLVIIDRYICKKTKTYKYKCNVCNFDEGEIHEHTLLKGIGCSCCARRTVVYRINDITTLAPWMIKYIKGGYNIAKQNIPGSRKSLAVICPDCNHEKTIQLFKLYRD